jgi:hypothetical protein
MGNFGDGSNVRIAVFALFGLQIEKEDKGARAAGLRGDSRQTPLTVVNESPISGQTVGPYN